MQTDLANIQKKKDEEKVSSHFDALTCFLFLFIRSFVIGKLHLVKLICLGSFFNGKL